MDDPNISRSRSIKTFLIFLVWCSKGLYLEIAGPTMIDLKLIFSTSYAAVTRSVSGRGVGGFLGAVVGAFLVDKYENSLDLAIGLSTTFASVFLSAIPFVQKIDYVWFLFFATGCLGGIINVTGIRAVLKMWKERSPSVLSALHMGYGVGALAAPIVCSPFLASFSTVPEANKREHQDYSIIKESRVEHAYLLIGMFTLTVSIPFYFFQYRQSKLVKVEAESISLQQTRPRTFKEMFNPGTYADGNFRFGLSMLVILFFYYFNLVGGQLSMASFVRTFSVDFYHFSKDQASMLNTGFWLSLTIGRFISAIISQYFTVKTLFPIQIVFHLCSAMLLCLYGTASAKVFSVLVLLESLLLAPLYPQGIAFGNTQMDIKGLSLMVIAFAGSFGDMVYIWTAGLLYDNHGPQSIFVLSILSAVSLVLCVVFFRNLAGWFKDTCPTAVEKTKYVCTH